MAEDNGQVEALHVSLSGDNAEFQRVVEDTLARMDRLQQQAQARNVQVRASVDTASFRKATDICTRELQNVDREITRVMERASRIPTPRNAQGQFMSRSSLGYGEGFFANAGGYGANEEALGIGGGHGGGGGGHGHGIFSRGSPAMMSLKVGSHVAGVHGTGIVRHVGHLAGMLGAAALPVAAAIGLAAVVHKIVEEHKELKKETKEYEESLQKSATHWGEIASKQVANTAAGQTFGGERRRAEDAMREQKKKYEEEFKNKGSFGTDKTLMTSLGEAVEVGAKRWWRATTTGAGGRDEDWQETGHAKRQQLAKQQIEDAKKTMEAMDHLEEQEAEKQAQRHTRDVDLAGKEADIRGTWSDSVRQEQELLPIQTERKKLKAQDETGDRLLQFDVAAQQEKDQEQARIKSLRGRGKLNEAAEAEDEAGKNEDKRQKQRERIVKRGEENLRQIDEESFYKKRDLQIRQDQESRKIETDRVAAEIEATTTGYEKQMLLLQHRQAQEKRTASQKPLEDQQKLAAKHQLEQDALKRDNQRTLGDMSEDLDNQTKHAEKSLGDAELAWVSYGRNLTRQLGVGGQALEDFKKKFMAAQQAQAEMSIKTNIAQIAIDLQLANGELTRYEANLQKIKLANQGKGINPELEKQQAQQQEVLETTNWAKQQREQLDPTLGFQEKLKQVQAAIRTGVLKDPKEIENIIRLQAEQSGMRTPVKGGSVQTGWRADMVSLKGMDRTKPLYDVKVTVDACKNALVSIDGKMTKLESRGA